MLPPPIQAYISRMVNPYRHTYADAYAHKLCMTRLAPAAWPNPKAFTLSDREGREIRSHILRLKYGQE